MPFHFAELIQIEDGFPVEDGDQPVVAGNEGLEPGPIPGVDLEPASHLLDQFCGLGFDLLDRLDDLAGILCVTQQGAVNQPDGVFE